LVAIYLLLPQIPMIFMGEEWRATTPFPYFCDFHGELADKVREGRRNEFKKFPEFQDPANRDRIPDPLAESTFQSAKLKWEEMTQPDQAECLDRHRKLTFTRQQEIVPLLDKIKGNSGSFQIVGDGAVVARWKIDDGRELRLCANLCDHEKDGFPESEGRVLWHQGPELQGTTYGPWTARWTLKDA
jgi:1,4-alpha-glucan branching enzyme